MTLYKEEVSRFRSNYLLGANERYFFLGEQNSKYFIAYFTKVRLIPEGDLFLFVSVNRAAGKKKDQCMR